MGNENNNLLKEQFSRPQIAATINSYMRSPKRMFEFLGSGIGAEYYAEKLEDLRSIVLCERDKEKRDSWKKSGRHAKLPIKDKCLFEDAIEVFELIEKSPIKFNVVNLDFCTFFYDNGKENCTAAIIRKVFEKKAIEKEGLMCFTFQVTGLGVNMHKTALKTKEDILNEIQLLAKPYGYGVEEVYSYIYKASKPTRMLNLIIKAI